MIHQIEKLDKFIEIRQESADCWTETLKQYKDYLLSHTEKDYDDYSQAYIPHMDKERGILISLNVEATR